MQGSEFAERRRGPGDDAAKARAERRAGGSAPEVRVAGSAAFVLGLQATAGNAAVAHLLRSEAPTAPVLPFPRRRRDAEPFRPSGPIVVARQEDQSAPADEEATGSPEQVITGVEGGPGTDGETGAADAAAEAGGETGGSSTDAGSVGEPGPVDAAAGEGEAAGRAASTGPGPEESSGRAAAEAGAEAAGGDVATGGDASGAVEDGEAAAEAGAEQAAGEGSNEEHSEAEQAEKQAEGETGSESDDHVATGGGGYPIAAHATQPPPGRFVDGGRAGTIPFTEAQLDAFDPEHDEEPHAFAAGGRTGTKAWAGGGGAGPKGNQEAGSIQNQVEPVYDSSWGGLFSNANAWVRDGTGVADVTRTYVTSDAGDQGNGWWISTEAATKLDAHERRHIANSKDQYESNVQPLLDRVASSRSLGANKTYKSADARTLLKQQIGWARGIDAFVTADKGYNAPNMMVDTNDLASGNLPRPQKGPRKIAGKDYDNYLIMNSEPDPT